SEEHTSELQSLTNLVCRLLLEKKKKNKHIGHQIPSHGRAVTSLYGGGPIGARKVAYNAECRTHATLSGMWCTRASRDDDRRSHVSSAHSALLHLISLLTLFLCTLSFLASDTAYFSVFHPPNVSSVLFSPARTPSVFLSFFFFK